MPDAIKAGDVVRLRSGGPKMTVTNVGVPQFGSKTMVWCVWFDGTDKKEGTFPPEAVVEAAD